ncbi:MAG: hypothetical protein ACF8MJ_10535 [Phycisphaerales bacterium JB050]
MPEHPEDSDRDPSPSRGRQRITFLGSQPPVGPPRNANVASDKALKLSSHRSGRADGQRKAEPVEPEPNPEDQKFPAALLIAPGFIALLFAASAANFVGDGTGTTTALLIGLAGMIGAIACFGALAAFSKERTMKMFCAVMIGVALMAYAQSFLALN